MSPRCLSCKSPLRTRSADAYSGDFCSEFCFSQYPAPAPSRRTPEWVRSMAASVEEVQRILLRNHDILRAFRQHCDNSPLASDIRGLTWLERQGFDFEHHTRLITNQLGETEVWCFDVGYRMDREGGVSPL